MNSSTFTFSDGSVTIIGGNFTASGIGDGNDDDTIAIQAALDAGGLVYIPKGVYLCGPLIAPAGIKIAGAGFGLSVIKLKPGSTGSLLTFADASGAVISGIGFDADHANSPLGNNCVEILGTGADFIFDEVSFKNAKAAGFHQKGTYTNGTVKNCVATGNQLDGVILTGSGMAIHGNTCKSNARFGILVTGADALITGNRCNGNGKVNPGGTGIQSNGAGIGVVGGARAVATGNTCSSNGDVANTLFSHGIQFNNVEGGTMSGNMCSYNSGSGLDFFMSPFGTCAGNQAIGNAVRGFEIDTASGFTTVTGNVARLNVEIGISIFNVIGAVVSSNVVNANGTGGTFANAMTGAANKPWGIALHGGGNYGNFAVVTGNQLNGNKGSGANGVGLWVDPACIEVTAENNVFGGNTAQVSAKKSNFFSAASNRGISYAALPA